MHHANETRDTILLNYYGSTFATMRYCASKQIQFKILMEQECWFIPFGVRQIGYSWLLRALRSIQTIIFTQVFFSLLLLSISFFISSLIFLFFFTRCLDPECVNGGNLLNNVFVNVINDGKVILLW